jgi:hypothetical protein
MISNRKRTPEPTISQTDEASALPASDVRLIAGAPATALPSAQECAVQDARNLCALVSANVRAAAHSPTNPDLGEVLADIQRATDQLSQVLEALAAAVKRGQTTR